MAKKKQKVMYNLVLFSEIGNMLCTGGTFETQQEAVDAVNDAMAQLPRAAGWKVIKVTKEVVQEGSGFTPNRSTLAPSSQERWW